MNIIHRDLNSHNCLVREVSPTSAVSSRELGGGLSPLCGSPSPSSLSIRPEQERGGG